MSKQGSHQSRHQSEKPVTQNVSQLQPRPFAPMVSAQADEPQTADLDNQSALESSPQMDFSFGKLNLFTGTAVTPPPPPITSSFVQTKLTIGAAGDKYEQEADQVAAQVVKTINSPDSSMQQKESGKENTLQMKIKRGRLQQRQSRPKISQLRMKPLTLQRNVARQSNLLLQMHTVLQPQVGAGGGTASRDIETSIQRERGSGQALGTSVRAPMEQAFGADFSNVKVHTDSTADKLNRSLGARAFTTGPDLFFKKGEFNPTSRSGQELLAHELTHVVQQGGAPNTISTQPDRIQRLVDPDYLEAKDPVNMNSHQYPRFLSGLGNYNRDMAAIELPAANYQKSVFAANRMNTALHTWVEPVLVPIAERKKNHHPILAGFAQDVEVEKEAVHKVSDYYKDYSAKKGADGEQVEPDLTQSLPPINNETNAKEAIDSLRTTAPEALYVDPEKGQKNESWWKLALEAATHGARSLIGLGLHIAAAVGSMGATVITSIPGILGALAHASVCVMKSFRAAWQRSGAAKGAKASMMSSFVMWEGIAGTIASAFGGLGLGVIFDGATQGWANVAKSVLKGTSAAFKTLANIIKSVRGKKGTKWGKWGQGMSKMIEDICVTAAGVVDKVSALLDQSAPQLFQLICQTISDAFGLVQGSVKGSRGFDDLKAAVDQQKAKDAQSQEDQVNDESETQ